VLADTIQISNDATDDTYLGAAIIIAGVPGGTELQMTVSNTNLFEVTDFKAGGTGESGTGGVRFRNLLLIYTATPVSEDSSTAISITNSTDVTAEEIEFTNWPCAMSDDCKSYGCGLKNSIVYPGTTPGAVGMSMQGTGDFCQLSKIIGPGTKAGTPPPGTVGIKLGSSWNTFFFTDSSIEQTYTGINILDGNYLFASNSNIRSYSQAILIQPASGKYITALFFDNVNFRIGTDKYGQEALVYIDTNDQAPTQVSGIWFNNCLFTGGQGPGLQLNSCDGVTVTGGKMGSNGLNASATQEPANIYVSGTVTDVHFNGVDLRPTFGVGAPSASLYGIAVADISDSSIFVDSCDLSGYEPPGALYVPAIPSP
jgi:hypothetical protein